MTKVSDPWYIGERAQQLAVVRLTRFSNVSVSHSPGDQGLDLLVTLSRPGRVFGVEIKGATEIAKLITPEGVLRKGVADEIARSLAEYPFPVAVLLFDMRSDEGYFGWVVAPALHGSAAELKTVDPFRVQPASDDVLRAAIAAVDAWYDARRVNHRLAS